MAEGAIHPIHTVSVAPRFSLASFLLALLLREPLGGRRGGPNGELHARVQHSHSEWKSCGNIPRLWQGQPGGPSSETLPNSIVFGIVWSSLTADYCRTGSVGGEEGREGGAEGLEVEQAILPIHARSSERTQCFKKHILGIFFASLSEE